MPHHSGTVPQYLVQGLFPSKALEPASTAALLDLSYYNLIVFHTTRFEIEPIRMMSQTAGMGLWSWSGLELALGERGANAEGQHGKATGATAGLRFQDELKRKTARTFIAQQLLQIFVSLKIVYRTNCDMVISETLGFARSLRQNGAPWLCRCRRGPWSASSWLCRKMKSIICVARSTRGFLWATISGLNWLLVA